MQTAASARTYSRAAITADVIGILNQMTADWDMDFTGGITEDTSLMNDCTFESIDIVMLIVAIEEAFCRKGLPFDKLLMVNGRYIDDLTVRDVIDFLERELA